MKYDIFIPVYCNNIELIDSSMVTFKTLRVGFPNARVNVFWMGGLDDAKERCKYLAFKNDCKWTNLANSNINLNHQLIENLLDNNLSINYNFISLDADVVFWKNMEGLEFPKGIAGRLIPEHYCNFTKAITRSRLHPSLLYFTDCSYIIESLKNLVDDIKDLKYLPIKSFIEPSVYYHNGKRIFSDTCSNLYHAIGGKVFEEGVLNMYDHLGCGGFVDKVEEVCPILFGGSVNLHKAIANKDINLARGLWKNQQAYFEHFAV